MSHAAARYFPVKAEALRMQAGLHRFGTDFGQGAKDEQFFQVDDDIVATLEAKRSVERTGRLAATTSSWGTSPSGRSQLVAAADWAWEVGVRDGVELPARSGKDPVADLCALCLSVQEDLVVLARRDDGAEEASFVHVCFPSGWRPESIVGANFMQIHAPVPRFADAPAVARSMTSSMIDRGPYVRFVWTVSADPHLDHHPTTGTRVPFAADAAFFFRVERQTTVPLPGHNAAIFLIRTYVRGFDQLTDDEVDTLRTAMELMPEDILRYKGLFDGRDLIVAALRSRQDRGA